MGIRVDSLTTVEIAPNLVRSATLTGAAIDVQQYTQMMAIILTSEAASTGDTLNGKIQDSADGSTGWADISGATFTEVTDAADLTETIFIDTDAIKRYIRFVGTIAGGTVSFAFGVIGLGAKQYR